VHKDDAHSVGRGASKGGRVAGDGVVRFAAPKTVRCGERLFSASTTAIKGGAFAGYFFFFMTWAANIPAYTNGMFLILNTLQT